MSKRLTVPGPNLHTTGEGFHVHAATCADLRHYGIGRKWGGENLTPSDTFTVASVQELIEIIYGDIIHENGDTWADGYESEFRFYPCVGDLPREDA